MADFRGYDIVRRITRTGFTTVRLARVQTGAPSLRTIKSFEPSPYVQDKSLVALRAHDFLESAKTQQEMGTRAPAHWVTVHEIAADADPPFVVADYYERSLAFLIEGQACLKAHTLHHLIDGIVQGLLTLKQELDRAHGNLRASNVLISVAEDLPHTQVALCDPLPDSYVGTDHETTDLRDLGELIHQLVVHRHTAFTPGWQAAAGPEWQRLGKQGEVWRNLCNRLLLVDIQPESITLESLVTELEGLQVKPPLSPRQALIRLGIATCLLVVLVLAWPLIRYTISPPQWDQTAWEHWFPAYRQWIAPLVELPPAQLSQWQQQDPTLTRGFRELVERCNQPFRHFDTEIPLKWRSLEDDSWRDPPEKFRQEYSYRTTMADTVKDANQALTALEDLLFDPHADTYWPWLQTLHEDINNLTRFQLTALQAYLAETVGQLQPDPNIAGSIDVLLQLQQGYTGIDIDFKRLHPDAAEDPALQTPAQTMAEFLKQRQQLPTFYRIDTAEIDAWRLPVEERLALARQRLQKAVDELADAEAQQGLQDLNALAQRLEEIRSLPPVEGQRVAIQSAYVDVNTTIESIDIDPEAWWDKTLTLDGVTDSEALNTFWRAYRNHWMGTQVQRTELKADPNFKAYWTLRRVIKEARNGLVRLNETLPPTLACPITTHPWTKVIGDYYRNIKREELLAAMVRDLYHNEPIPTPDFKAITTAEAIAVPESWQRCIAWPQQAAVLVTDLAKIDQLLVAWYHWEEASDTNKTLSDHYQTWTDHTLLKELITSADLTPLQERFQRLEQLRDIQTEPDPNTLIQLAQHPPSHGEAAWALWLRLGEKGSSSWPITETHWSLETKLQTDIETALHQTGMDPTRKSAHQQRFTIERFKRHQTILGIVAGGDETLQQLCATETNEAVSLLPLIQAITQLVINNPEWPTAYNSAAFHAMDSELTGKALPERCRHWLAHVPEWKIIPDPRAGKDVAGQIAKLEGLIRDGRKEAQDDPETRKHLEADKKELEPLKRKILALNNSDTFPAVQRYRTKLDTWQEYFSDLLELEKRVKDHLYPPYCRYIQLVNQGRLAFKDTLPSLTEFDPVYFDAGKFTVQLPANINRLQAFEKRTDVRDKIFSITDPGSSEGERNIGWPTFIQSHKDPSVILRFVPAATAQQRPFYLSISEITNQQYGLFLEQEKPNATHLGEWLNPSSFPPYPSVFCRREVTLAGHVNIVPHRPARIDPNNANHPVVWIRSAGALAYAYWIEAQLPQQSWHERALGTLPPQDATTIHERDVDWKKALDQYNRSRQPTLAQAESDASDLTKVKPAPMGAKVEAAFEFNKPFLNEEIELSPPNQFNDIWPSESFRWREQHTTPPTCYDLVGNVWEWVLDNDQLTLWGGSCLSPLNAEKTTYSPEYTAPIDRQFDKPKEERVLRNTDCDVGFRIALPCPTVP